MAIVQGSALLTPGLIAAFKKAYNSLPKPHVTFSFEWNPDTNMVTVKAFTHGTMTSCSFDQEYLEDMGADEFVRMILQMGQPQPTALHCYDLGDGILVPCDLVHEIINWMNASKPQHSWWMSKEMIEDDMYGPAAKAGTKSIAEAVDKSIMDELKKENYPSKVWMIDYLQPYKDYFIVNPTTEAYNFIPSGYYGSSIIDQIESAKIAIPKKPKQVTKESLQHFHKLLGGKKDPFIK